MTQDEIIEMARQAGFMMENSAAIQAAEIFADLVAAKEQKKWQDQTAVEIHEAILEEREACAKAVEAEAHMFATNAAAKSLADGIRDRGEA
jgi:hypothetical protein